MCLAKSDYQRLDKVKQSVSEFNEFEQRLKSAKNNFKGTVHLFGFLHGKLNSPCAVEWY